MKRYRLLQIVTTVATVGILEVSTAFAASSAGAAHLVSAGNLFGNIPNVTVRGVAAGLAPWVIKGQYRLTSTRLWAQGAWLIIPKGGHLASGKVVPAALGGTTAGVPMVGAEITFANARPIITKPVPLSKQGNFLLNTVITIPKGAVDPVVLIGTEQHGAMNAWFASSNFLMDYGLYSGTHGSKSSMTSSSSKW